VDHENSLYLRVARFDCQMLQLLEHSHTLDQLNLLMFKTHGVFNPELVEKSVQKYIELGIVRLKNSRNPKQAFDLFFLLEKIINSNIELTPLDRVVNKIYERVVAPLLRRKLLRMLAVVYLLIGSIA